MSPHDNDRIGVTERSVWVGTSTSSPRPGGGRLLYKHAVLVLWLNIALGVLLFVRTWPHRAAIAQHYSPYGYYIIRSVFGGLYWSFFNFGWWFAGVRFGATPARIMCGVWGAWIVILILIHLANWPMNWFEWSRLYTAAALLAYAFFGDRPQRV